MLYNTLFVHSIFFNDLTENIIELQLVNLNELSCLLGEKIINCTVVAKSDVWREFWF